MLTNLAQCSFLTILWFVLLLFVVSFLKGFHIYMYLIDMVILIVAKITADCYCMSTIYSDNTSTSCNA